jgi:hypothetical protein
MHEEKDARKEATMKRAVELYSGDSSLFSYGRWNVALSLAITRQMKEDGFNPNDHDSRVLYTPEDNPPTFVERNVMILDHGLSRSGGQITHDDS